MKNFVHTACESLLLELLLCVVCLCRSGNEYENPAKLCEGSVRVGTYCASTDTTMGPEGFCGPPSKTCCRKNRLKRCDVGSVRKLQRRTFRTMLGY